MITTAQILLIKYLLCFTVQLLSHKFCKCMAEILQCFIIFKFPKRVEIANLTVIFQNSIFSFEQLYIFNAGCTVLLFIVLHMPKKVRVTCSVVKFYQLQYLKILFLIRRSFAFVEFIIIHFSFSFRKQQKKKNYSLVSIANFLPFFTGVSLGFSHQLKDTYERCLGN